MVNEMLDFSKEDDDVSELSEFSSIHEEDIPVSVSEIAGTSGVPATPLITIIIAIISLYVIFIIRFQLIRIHRATSSDLKFVQIEIVIYIV